VTTLGSAGLASRDDPDHVVSLAETVDYDDEAEGRAKTEEDEPVFVVRVIGIGDYERVFIREGG
jgi:hypothetical protein